MIIIEGVIWSMDLTPRTSKDILHIFQELLLPNGRIEYEPNTFYIQKKTGIKTQGWEVELVINTNFQITHWKYLERQFCLSPTYLTTYSSGETPYQEKNILTHLTIPNILAKQNGNKVKILIQTK